MQELWVRTLNQEDPLEEEMAVHSCILAWKIPWTSGPGGPQSMDHKESDTTEATEYSPAHTYVPSLLNLPPTGHPLPPI